MSTKKFNTMEIRKRFSMQLQSLRTEKKLTQTELAEKLGVHEQSVSNWERCTRTPTSNLLKKIEEFFGLLEPLITQEEIDFLAQEKRSRQVISRSQTAKSQSSLTSLDKTDDNFDGSSQLGFMQNTYSETIAALKDLVELQKETINNLKEQNEYLKAELNRTREARKTGSI